MNLHTSRMFLVTMFATIAVAASANAQHRTQTPAPTPQSLQQRYGVQGTYDGTFLHPDGHRSAAVPVSMEDGRNGELVIPADRRDSHSMYYRDDVTGEMHPVKVDPHATRSSWAEARPAAR